jgi:hypothetical protein
MTDDEHRIVLFEPSLDHSKTTSKVLLLLAPTFPHRHG